MTTAVDYAPPMNEDWITRAEAAERLGVSLQTVDRYTSSGEITTRKNELTRRVRLRVSDVDRIKRLRDDL